MDTARERVLLDGVPLVQLGDSGYRLIKYLAERAVWAAGHAGKGEARTALAETKDTDAAISGNRHSDGTTRRAVWKLRARVKESFAEVGARVPAEVAKKGLVVWVIEARLEARAPRLGALNRRAE